MIDMCRKRIASNRTLKKFKTSTNRTTDNSTQFDRYDLPFSGKYPMLTVYTGEGLNPKNSVSNFGLGSKTLLSSPVYPMIGVEREWEVFRPEYALFDINDGIFRYVSKRFTQSFL